MIRIEILPDGVLQVITGANESVYEKTEDLAPDVRDKFEILRASDVGSRIQEVGFHITDTVIYVAEPGDAPFMSLLKMTNGMLHDIAFNDLYDFYKTIEGV